MENKTKYGAADVFLSLAIGGIVGSIVNMVVQGNTIPRARNMEDGFVNPRRLEIKLTDYDFDKRNELVMKYEGKEYMMKFDIKENMVKLIPYTMKLKPVEYETPEIIKEVK